MKPILGDHDRLRLEGSRLRGLEPIIALFRPRLRFANPDLEPSELLSHESDGGKGWLHLPARGAGRQAETLRTAAPRSGGLGRVFQRTYKGPKTGELKTMKPWWIEFHHNGKQIRKPS